jgi:hypothetical protein
VDLSIECVVPFDSDQVFPPLWQGAGTSRAVEHDRLCRVRSGKDRDLPLLFKRNDVFRTDIKPAL